MMGAEVRYAWEVTFKWNASLLEGHAPTLSEAKAAAELAAGPVGVGVGDGASTFIEREESNDGWQSWRSDTMICWEWPYGDGPEYEWIEDVMTPSIAAYRGSFKPAREEG